jgi:hypothetical protein
MMTVRCPSCRSESPDWFDTCKTCGYDLSGSDFEHHPQIDFRHNPQGYLFVIFDFAASVFLAVIVVSLILVSAAWTVYAGVSHGNSDETWFGVYSFGLGCIMAVLCVYSYRQTT